MCNTRDARMRKPCASRCAMIFPALPVTNASGLMIVSVKLPAMSESYEFANDVPASEKADEPAFAHDGNAFDVLVAHQRRDFCDRLFGRDAEHLPRHGVTHGFTARRRLCERARIGEHLRGE